MSEYFTNFPRIQYDINGTNLIDPDYTVVVNLMVKQKVRDAVDRDIIVYYPYHIPPETRPEIVSYQVYGDVSYTWSIFYANKIEVNEIAVQKELQEIIEKKLLLEEFKLSEIEFTVNKENKNEIIKNIQNQIKNYGFKVAANKFSISPSSKNNGEIGWVNSKSLDPKIYEIISEMEVGDISIPFERQDSLMILRLDDKKKTQYQNIDSKKVKENLINQKKNELFNLYSRSHLSKIKNSSLIEYR